MGVKKLPSLFVGEKQNNNDTSALSASLPIMMFSIFIEYNS